VDRASARQSIADRLDWCDWWLDAGNGLHSGQILLGNTKNIDGLNESFEESFHTVSSLPVPSLQLPSLLNEPTKPETPAPDCADAVEEGGQSPIINQAMATMVLEFMNRLLSGRLTWMGAYIDLDAGTMSTVPAEPEIVARMLGVKVNTLIKSKSRKRR